MSKLFSTKQSLHEQYETGPNNPNAGEQTIVNDYDTFLDLKFVCLFNLHVLHKWKL